jgi:hypothetical protein
MPDYLGWLTRVVKITCLYPQLSDPTRKYGATFHDKLGLSFHVACIPRPEC